nr:uncharacterized protein LOC119168117 [Rhipicephalus microplus]
MFQIQRMAEERLWFIFLWTSILATQAGPAGRNYFNALDIRKFYRTRHPIWCLQTTERTQYTCKVDVTRIITRDYVIFSRLYYWYIAKVNNTLEGVFQTGEKKATNPDRMMVHFPKIMFTETEQVQYESSDSHCGVFLISSIAGSTYASFDKTSKTS